jgi:hypothetical protein
MLFSMLIKEGGSIFYPLNVWQKQLSLSLDDMLKNPHILTKIAALSSHKTPLPILISWFEMCVPVGSPLLWKFIDFHHLNCPLPLSCN